LGYLGSIWGLEFHWRGHSRHSFIWLNSLLNHMETIKYQLSEKGYLTRYAIAIVYLTRSRVMRVDQTALLEWAVYRVEDIEK
jgi:hypothetical protein